MMPAVPSVSSSELITERAQVLSVERELVWVRCESQAGCARCAAGEGCGAGLFAKLLRGRLQSLPLRLPAPLQGHLHAGDQVLIGLSVSAVQNASLLLYGVPLAGLLAGAIAATLLGPGSDLAALAGAMIGLAGGLFVVRRAGERLAVRAGLEPVLLRQLAPGEPCSAPAEA